MSLTKYKASSKMHTTERMFPAKFSYVIVNGKWSVGFPLANYATCFFLVVLPSNYSHLSSCQIDALISCPPSTVTTPVPIVLPTTRAVMLLLSSYLGKRFVSRVVWQATRLSNFFAQMTTNQVNPTPLLQRSLNTADVRVC